MAKCELCNEKKARRDCPALAKKICTFCCATKRETEIDCPTDCEHLNSGKDFKIRKEIEKAVRNGLYEIKKNVFENSDAAALISEVEKYLAVEFWENYDVNDHKIYNALSKIYAAAIGMKVELKFDDKYEQMIADKYLEVQKKYETLSAEIKNNIVIKTLDNIKKDTGGEYCDRSYLRGLHIKNGGKVFF